MRKILTRQLFFAERVRRPPKCELKVDLRNVQRRRAANALKLVRFCCRFLDADPTGLVEYINEHVLEWRGLGPEAPAALIELHMARCGCHDGAALKKPACFAVHALLMLLAAVVQHRRPRIGSEIKEARKLRKRAGELSGGARAAAQAAIVVVEASIAESLISEEPLRVSTAHRPTFRNACELLVRGGFTKSRVTRLIRDCRDSPRPATDRICARQKTDLTALYAHARLPATDDIDRQN